MLAKKKMRSLKRGSLLEIPPDCFCIIYQYLREDERWIGLGFSCKYLRKILTEAIGIFEKIQDFRFAICWGDVVFNRVNLKGVKTCTLWGMDPQYRILFSLPTLMKFIRAMPNLKTLLFVHCEFQMIFIAKCNRWKFILDNIKNSNRTEIIDCLNILVKDELEKNRVDYKELCQMPKRKHDLNITVVERIKLRCEWKDVIFDSLSLYSNYYYYLFKYIKDQINPQFNIYFKAILAEVCYYCGKIVNEGNLSLAHHLPRCSTVYCKRVFCLNCIGYKSPSDNKNTKRIITGIIYYKKNYTQKKFTPPRFHLFAYCGSKVGQSLLCYLCISPQNFRCSVCHLRSKKDVEYYRCRTCDKIVYSLQESSPTIHEFKNHKISGCSFYCASCLEITCLNCKPFPCQRCNLVRCLKCYENKVFCCH